MSVLLNLSGLFLKHNDIEHIFRQSNQPIFFIPLFREATTVLQGHLDHRHSYSHTHLEKLDLKDLLMCTTVTLLRKEQELQLHLSLQSSIFNPACLENGACDSHHVTTKMVTCYRHNLSILHKL